MAGGISGQSVTTAYTLMNSRAAPRFLRGIQDQIFNDHPIWQEMTKRVSMEPFDGGNDIIYKAVDLARGQDDGSYRDLDIVDTSRVDTETIIQVRTAEYFKPVTISSRERDLHRGKLAVARSVEASMRKAMNRIVYDLNLHFALDGTGNSSKRIIGFDGWVNEDPTAGSIGGLSRANNSAWRNITANNSNTVGDILLNLRTACQSATIGNDGPQVIFGNEAGKNALEGQMTSDINHNLPVGSEGSTRSGDAAVPRVFYRGIPVVADKDWTQYGTVTGPGQLVGINTRYWSHVNANAKVSKDRFFELVAPQRAPTQTAEVGGIRYHGQWLCTSLRHQFVIQNIGADA